MPTVRVQLASDPTTARRVRRLHQADKIHHDSREAARAEVRRLGWTPAADPVFIGLTNGNPPRLIYETEVDSETTR
ncbi:hypothetical protein [Actinoplanes sp. RD1]|uniref:hypothetical protein n=1 Tax=Actinoplanes sp. RD1 TaxID=3064538 RepID=UPI002740C19D|nr:hypothetical protein [Actinoplanes sp. RD1]